MDIGQRIKELRQKNKISQEHLAKELDKAKSLIGHMESGKSRPTLESIEIMCKLFNTSSDYLIFGIEEIKENEDERPLLEIYRQLNNDNKAVCRYKAKELLKEQQQDEKSYTKTGNL